MRLNIEIDDELLKNATCCPEASSWRTARHSFSSLYRRAATEASATNSPPVVKDSA